MSQLSKWLLSGSTPLWAPRRGRTWTWRKSWGPKMTCRWSSKCHRSRTTQIVSIVLVRWNQSNWLNRELCPRRRGYGYDGRHVLPRDAGNMDDFHNRKKEMYFQHRELQWNRHDVIDSLRPQLRPNWRRHWAPANNQSINNLFNLIIFHSLNFHLSITS